MPEILRAPIEPAFYRAVPNRRLVAGGSTTSFIELPYNYLIGGFEYSKELLASVRNGYFGLYTDTKSLALSDYAHNQTASPNASTLNANMLHAGILGYFGGAYQVVSSLNNYATQNALNYRAVARGTVGRRVRPMSVIRDTEDTAIVYAVLSGPNLNQFFGVAKINTNTRETLWRHTDVENITEIGATIVDTNPAPGFIGWSAIPVEYLYQDSTSLYFLYGGPRNRNMGSAPSSVYIYAVNKNTGALTEITYFNLYTLGVTTYAGWCWYKFLGFTDQHTFLLELHQINRDGADSAAFSTNSVNGNYGDGCAYTALVQFDLNDLHGRVLWKSDPLVPPIYSNYHVLYPLTGSLILPELGDSLFVPLMLQTVWNNSSSEAIVQVYLNPAHTEVLDSKILPVINAFGYWQTIGAGSQSGYINVGVDSYTYPAHNSNYYYGGFTVATSGNIPYNINYVNRFTNMLEGQGYTAMNAVSLNSGRLPYARTRVSSYDHLITKRRDPVLRIHALSPEGKPRKTILPCGEDIIGQGYYAGYYDKTTAITNEYRYTGSSGVAHPWGVIVSHSGFSGNSNMLNCYGLTPRNQGYPMAYADNHTQSAPDYNSSYVWTGTLPGCSYTLRRSDTNLSDCAIYLNDDIFPIFAVSYSINPHTQWRDSAPISWFVEAHDVETDTWIEVDRQENVALTYPPTYNRGDYTRSGAQVNYNSYGYQDYRQYRNYFPLKDMRTKCPKGAHAFRITFTDSANGTTVVIGSWMIQEEPWPWKQAVAPEATFIGSGSHVAYSYAANGTASSTSTYVYAASTMGSVPTYYSNTSYLVVDPITLSIVGPRTHAHVPPMQFANTSVTDTPYFMNGAALFSSNTNGINTTMYLTCTFTSAIEAIGIQFTMMGLRATLNPNTIGCSVPNGVTISASVDGSNWEVIANIPAAKLPGLVTSYVNNKQMWSKTFLYEFDTPKSYRFFRVAAAGSYVDGTSSNTTVRRIWVIQNFSVIQKRDDAFAKTAIPMQSLLDKHYFNNTRSSENFDMTALFDIATQPKATGFWDPWLTHHPSTYGATPSGFRWGGFDAYGNLHCGYSSTGFLRSNTAPTQDLICNAGYITEDTPVTLMASWRGMLSRAARYGLDGNKVVADYANGLSLSDPDVQTFRKAIYADRIKIVAYAFAKSNYIAVTKGAPYHWKVYGSVDGTTWTLIDEKTKTTWTDVETLVEFTIDNPDWFVYYKWEFLETSDGGLNLLSIDTFIAGIDENNQYAHTIIPRNGTIKWASSAEIEEGTVVRGTFAHDHVAWVGRANAVSVTYGAADMASIIVDQIIALETHSMMLALNPSMEAAELPKHVKIQGSVDKEDWTDVYENTNMVWDFQKLYRQRVNFTTPGIYRYLRVIFCKPDVTWDDITEYWLLNTAVAPGYTVPQQLFKFKPDEALILTACDLYQPWATLWISDTTVATVHTESIAVRRLNPITQRMDAVRTITAPNGNYILGTVLDSGKNIWYWTNTASSKDSAHDPDSVTGEPDGYCALCVHSSYSASTVHVRFENSTARYSGSPLTLKAFTWIDNPFVDGDDKRVAGQIKLVLSGGNAKFVSNGEDTITVTAEAGQDTEVEFTASGPDRVSITATLLK